MIKGIAVICSELPCHFLDEYSLAKRIADRADEREEPEIHFLWGDRMRVLPVWVNGQLILAKWGNQNPKHSLPTGNSTQLVSWESGKWSQWKGIKCLVPAQMALDRIWYDVHQGIQAVLVLDEKQEPVVYLLMEPSTQYYKMLTGSSWMPVFLDQRI